MRRFFFLLLIFSAYSNAQTYLMQGNAVITTCSGTFYDSGGPTANYGTNQNYTVTFCPSTPGTYLQLEFTDFLLEGEPYDYMSIYNGTGTSGQLIGFFGTGSPLSCSGIVASSDPSGCLTVVFNSDSSQTRSGWAANISCSPLSGGSAIAIGNAVCSGATPFCANSGTLEFPNNSNTVCLPGAPPVIIANTCLQQAPNPAWYYLEIATSGLIQMDIIQRTQQGGLGTGLDVDFAMWGPFSTVSSACANFTLGNCTGNHNCTGNVIDCSYSTSDVETATIPNAIAGEFYMVLITNYQGTPGFISVMQTNAGTPGAGATDCHVICPSYAGTSPTSCGSSNGSITISGLVSGTSYAISYLDDGTATNTTLTANATGNVIITGLNAGNYTSISANIVGCSVLGTVTLNALTAPILNSVSAVSSVCSGNNVIFTLNGTPNSNVTYHINSGPNLMVSLNALGTATVQVNTVVTSTTFYATSISIPSCSATILKTAVVIIKSSASIVRNPSTGSATQILCSGVAITPIVYTVSNATNANATNLPAGLFASFSAGQFSISGTPTQFGANTFTISTSGGCGVSSTNVTITVNSAMTIQQISPVLNSQIVCKNVNIIPFEYTIGNGATGASVSGLPLGISGTYTNGNFKITGAPTQIGVFNFSVAPLGGCNGPTLTGIITVNDLASIQLQSGSNTQLICANSAITPIIYQIVGATGAQVTGLPNGVTGNFSAGNFTISGTPDSNANFNYDIVTTGGCSSQHALGTITFKPQISFGAVPVLANQNVCVGAAVIPIQFSIQNATGASISGLPTGMLGNFSAGIFTISGIPTNNGGTFPYVITATGSCQPSTTSGTITINSSSSMTLQSQSNSQTICKNENLNSISYQVSGGITNVLASGLPPGIVGSLINSIYTITGVCSIPGIYPFALSSSGGCSSITINGIITVSNDAQITHLTTSGNQTQTVCVNSTISPISFSLLSGANNASISGLPSGLSMTVNSGIAIISGTSAAAGSFPYTISTSGGCSSASKSGIITISSPATALLSYQTLIYCNEENVNTSALVTGTGNYLGGTFSSTPAGLNINQNTGNFNPKQSNAGNYLITYTSLASGGCLGAKSTASIIIHPIPKVFATPNSQSICSENFTSIVLSSDIIGTTFNYTVIQNGVSGAQNSIGNVISQQLIATHTVAGTVIYRITPTSPQGCVGLPITVIVKVNPLPAVMLEDGIVCMNLSTGTAGIPYVLNSGLSNAVYTFIWFRDGIIIPLETENSLLAQRAGIYKVVATNILTGCTSTSAEATVTEAPIADYLTLEGNTAFAENPTVKVTIPIPGNYLYQLDNRSTQNANTFTELAYGNHLITVKDEFGCTDITYNFTVIGYPKFFTPNGDNYNDTWNIIGLPEFASQQIFIYDRYGKLLREIINAVDGWDGTYNGQQLPSTDYWFTVDYTDKNVRKQFKSHFALKR